MVWEPWQGPGGTEDNLGCDLSGHFHAQVRKVPGGWAHTVWDYQGNVMADGVAATKEAAKESVEVWDWEVVASRIDPSRDWTDL